MPNIGGFQWSKVIRFNFRCRGTLSWKGQRRREQDRVTYRRTLRLLRRGPAGTGHPVQHRGWDGPGRGLRYIDNPIIN